MEGKGSLLIVDDNISLCKTMSFVLRRKGYAVTTAKDGLEAIKMIKESSPDMIFMDIKMPLINGVETYRRIKKIMPEVVVIMMTAYAVDDLVQEALQEGAYEIIYKPLDFEKMVSLVERVREVKQGLLILLVDDHSGTCITLKNVLTRRGHKVAIAHTGEEAIAMAKETAYDIIFIDMKLPTINGLETYLIIKETNWKAVVIMMTAYRQEMDDLVAVALQNSAYSCLYKPFDMVDVLRLVDEVWKGKQKAG